MSRDIPTDLRNMRSTGVDMSRLSSTLLRGVTVPVSVLLAMHAGMHAGLCKQDQDGATVVGRVRVTEVSQEKRARFQEVMQALEAALAAAPGRPFADKRLISLRPRPDDPGPFDATIYDYSVQRGFNIVVDGLGNERSREAPRPRHP